MEHLRVTSTSVILKQKYKDEVTLKIIIYKEETSPWRFEGLHDKERWASQGPQG